MPAPVSPSGAPSARAWSPHMRCSPGVRLTRMERSPRHSVPKRVFLTIPFANRRGAGLSISHRFPLPNQVWPPVERRFDELNTPEGEARFHSATPAQLSYTAQNA